LSKADGHGVGRPGSKEGVKFDDFNALVHHNATKEYIDLLVSVPLADGALAKATVTLRAPVRLANEDGKYEYSMNFDTKLSVIQAEKNPTGNAEIAERDGLSWEIPGGGLGARTALLEHEPWVKELLTSHFRPDDVFVDVGANVGAYSVRAASGGMKVYAFEPNPETVKVLKRNAEINHVSIDLLEYALGSADGNAKMSPNGALSRISADGAIEVPLRTLDSFDLPRVDLLKVDVEGYELEVLKGARKTLARCHPTVFVEMHDWLAAEDEASLFNILLENGYHFRYLDKESYGRHLIALHDEARAADSAS
jgi:FkbM family methyltransferase